jgi:hypothetical protein
MPELLTDREIINFLRTLRHDKYFKHAQRVPIDSLCRLMGMSRQTAYMVMLGRYPISTNVRAKLSHGHDLVCRGLQFTRRWRHWTTNLDTLG